MKKILTIVFSCSLLLAAQNLDTSSASLHSSENIIRFADHLFCEKDYLRASLEYLRIDERERDELTNLKLGLSYSSLGEYSLASMIFEKINKNSSFYNYAKLEMLKIHFLQNEFSMLKEYAYDVNPLIKNVSKKLYNFAFLKDRESIPTLEEFLAPFDESERNDLKKIYYSKLKPDYKSPIKAALFSAVIPGSGKVYTEEIGDGIYAFLLSGLFAFLAYDNFRAQHDFRAWLFAGLSAGFYAGNVYGSYASAQIYNARIKYEFNFNLDSLLESKNYFIPQYKLCD